MGGFSANRVPKDRITLKIGFQTAERVTSFSSSLLAVLTYPYYIEERAKVKRRKKTKCTIIVDQVTTKCIPKNWAFPKFKFSFDYLRHDKQINDKFNKNKYFCKLVFLRTSPKRKWWQVLNVLKEAPTSPRFRGNKDTTFPPRGLE